ncbi:transmembrane protease serine 9-like [Macrobrachium rosenbergii]|uniref:transmembrane protease serine 9-like n=1 Tax=Macrobrachium rosenbergii TaxID=79674 RepID=UPI0034D5DD96
MDSVRLTLALIFLGVCCIGRTSASKGNETWIMRPLGRGSVAQQRRNISHVQPRWTLMPRNFESPTNQPVPKEGRSTYVSCGYHSLEPGQTVSIKSRNFPRKYPRNENCRWTFEGTSPASTISISCSTFQLMGCRKSYLRITGGNLYEKYCGVIDGLTAASSNNYMGILFRTGRSRRRRSGFSCTVSASEVPTTTTKAPAPSTTTKEPAPSTSGSSVTEVKSCEPCGTVNRATRIVGGVETEVNEYPWQAAIVYAGTNTVFCGGSLLNNELVLTAAHCVDAIFNIYANNQEVDVLLGVHDLNNPTTYQQRIGLANAGAYYLYDSSTLDHDTGLIWLSSPAVLSERVKPVCLPDVSKDYNGFMAVTSGWGSLTEGGSQPNILNEVEVPIITNEDCNTSYDGSITSNMICAGYPSGGKDACQGDSGGPLVVEDNGKWVLVGITSWGNGCARPNYPGVYARVTQYVSDLSDVMGQYGANNLCNGTTAATPIETSAAALIRTTLAPTNGPPPSDGCKCGRRNPVTRIVGGQPTTVHEYPWQVALTTSSRPFCGGSIISKQWILTAAHCVRGSSPSDFTVVIGEHDWSTTSETTATERRQVSNIIVHPQYNSATLDNDMALLKLSSPISFPSDNKIAPVCLPDPNNDYANVDAIVTGWGTTTSGGSQPYKLYEVTVPTMTNTKCNQAYSGEITSNMICAGLDAGGKDSCQGDSGGPMVTAGNTAQTFMVQIGVVSWGYGCAAAGYPGVYARVNNYLSWISSNTAGSETCPRP